MAEQLENDLLENIRSSNWSAVLEIARQLNAIRYWERPLDQPRGTVEVSANSLFSNSDTSKNIRNVLPLIPDFRVERELIVLLGEWAGEEAINDLDQLANSGNEKITTSCLFSLYLIGGPKAITAIQKWTSESRQSISSLAKGLLMCLGVE